MGQGGWGSCWTPDGHSRSAAEGTWPAGVVRAAAAIAAVGAQLRKRQPATPACGAISGSRGVARSARTGGAVRVSLQIFPWASPNLLTRPCSSRGAPCSLGSRRALWPGSCLRDCWGALLGAKVSSFWVSKSCFEVALRMMAVLEVRYPHLMGFREGTTGTYSCVKMSN